MYAHRFLQTRNKQLNQWGKSTFCINFCQLPTNSVYVKFSMRLSMQQFHIHEYWQSTDWDAFVFGILVCEEKKTMLTKYTCRAPILYRQQGLPNRFWVSKPKWQNIMGNKNKYSTNLCAIIVPYLKNFKGRDIVYYCLPVDLVMRVCSLVCHSLIS